MRGYPIAAEALRVSNGVIEGRIALCFGLNAFRRPSTLLLLKGNGKIFYAAPGMGTAEMASFVRWYDGIDNAVDPFIESLFAPDPAPSYENYLIVVVENGQLEQFGGYPEFTAVWSDDSASVQSVTTLSTPFPVNFSNPAFIVGSYCYDPALHRIYQYYKKGTNHFLGTIDLNAGTEIARVSLSAQCEAMVALPGSEYVMGMNGTTVQLVDTTDGSVLASSGSGQGDYVMSAMVYETATTSKYLALVKRLNKWRLAIATPGSLTLSDVVDQGTASLYDDPVACAGARASNSCQFFATWNDRVFEVLHKNGATTVKKIYDGGASVYMITGIAFDASDLTVVITYLASAGGASYAAKVTQAGVVMWTKQLSAATEPVRIWDGVSRSNGIVNDYMKGFARMRSKRAIVASSALTDSYDMLDLTDGSTTSLGVDGAMRAVYDDLTGTFYGFGTAPDLAEWVNPTSAFWTKTRAETTLGDIPIADVLRDFSTYNGVIKPAQLSYVGLDGLTCKGFAFTSNFDTRQAITSICDAYNIGFFESGSGVKFVRKEQDEAIAIDKTIPAEDLIEETSEPSSHALASTRAFDLEIPVKVEMQFIDPDKEFETGTVAHERPRGVFEVTNSSRQESLSLPLCIPAEMAKTLSVQVLYNRSAKRNLNRFALPPEYMLIEPCDLLEIETDDGTQSVMVEATTVREDFTIEIEAADYLADTITTTAADGGTAAGQGVDLVGSSRYIHLDLPLLRSSDDRDGDALVQYHLLTSRGQPAWNGAMLFRGVKPDPLNLIDSQYGFNPVVGVAMEVIPAPPDPFSIDLTNTLTVAIAAGKATSFTSCTYLQMMNGRNLAAYGRPGRWELIRFQTVTANADGSRTLSKLHRGLKGTEVYAGQHQEGDLVVPLIPSQVSTLFYRLDALGDYFYFKTYASKANPVGVLEYRKVSGAAERCYAPVQLEAAIDGSDIDLTWIRRSRLHSPWGNDGSTSPLGEATESYDVEIMDGASVVRTYAAVTTQAKTYLAAHITADFGSMPATLTWRVYQNSAVTGRGHRAETTSTL